jgi:hypothetical protein
VHLAAERGWQRRTGVVDEHDHDVGRTHGR